MRIDYSLYELDNLHNNATRKGALLRCMFSDGKQGYADCHPWTELGDYSLTDQLQRLASGSTSSLTERSLFFARLDALARDSEVSLFKDLPIPPSHFLIPDIIQWNPTTIHQALQQGFTHLKIKAGNAPTQELFHIKRLIKEHPTISLRLDFNAKLSSDTCEFWLKELSPYRSSIDFFEDPFIFDRDKWSSLQTAYNFTFARDRDSHLELVTTQSHVVVIKPAIQSEHMFPTCWSKRLVITSYLDHPLGQLGAAYVAAKMKLNHPHLIDICGLTSHLSYQTNTFSECFHIHQACLKPPGGTGFGFDTQLKQLQWSFLV